MFRHLILWRTLTYLAIPPGFQAVVTMPQACPACPEKTLFRDQHPVAKEADETLLRTWGLMVHVEEMRDNQQ